MTFIRMTASSSRISRLGNARLCSRAPVKTVDSAKGKVLAGENGMTLYTFKKDTKGCPTAKANSLANWPALKAAADAKDAGAYTVITRKDGSKQWAKDGMPLYYWART